MIAGKSMLIKLLKHNKVNFNKGSNVMNGNIQDGTNDNIINKLEGG
jgi:hypothetical protein